MVSVSFTISGELKTKMDEFSWINWSEVAREDAIKQQKKLKLFKELDKLTKNSTLSDKDCLELGRMLKKDVWERLKKEEGL